MPILDDAARNKSLANDYGPTRGPNAAASHTVELWDGDPSLDGSAQITGGGYAASAPVAPGDWSAPDGGQIQATPTFPSPTGAWSTATHFVLRGSDGLGWDYGVLAEPLYVTGAGGPPEVTVTVFYNDPDDL